MAVLEGRHPEIPGGDIGHAERGSLIPAGLGVARNSSFGPVGPGVRVSLSQSTGGLRGTSRKGSWSPTSGEVHPCGSVPGHSAEDRMNSFPSGSAMTARTMVALPRCNVQGASAISPPLSFTVSQAAAGSLQMN